MNLEMGLLSPLSAAVASARLQSLQDLETQFTDNISEDVQRCARRGLWISDPGMKFS